ncbi:transmembrane amino acid transporter protein-domain-containing protein [Kockovaella imperatae]|uniref:Transmembrane amino acid transporter protein-domain-containing protein n=1 Tax=Kockovaella imperatae TaxID=4999 RepID=A0A1Y1UTE8_9TREE|nr:transmembrane amino acid transporter protein-domain-containing protein [Kockovaella imperatae]ORX41300.1 transmembrane amino acid transporter protein-domain-containing protein [Kockovaella imperatae]
MSPSTYQDNASLTTDGLDQHETGGKDAVTGKESDASRRQEAYNVDPFQAHKDAGHKDYVEFRTCGWITAGVVTTAEAIALGTLSFPSTFLRLGIVGGVICTLLAGFLTCITTFIIVDFKLRHMGCTNWPEVGTVLGGKVANRILAVGLVAKCIGIAGSHVLAGQEAITTIHGNANVCRIVWGVITAIASVILSYPRKWHGMHVLSYISISSILIACMVTIVGTGVQNPDVLTKGGAPIEWYATPQDASLVTIIGAATNVIFAYGAVTGALSFCSEMHTPKDYKKSIFVYQLVSLVVYLLTGALIYVFGGQYTTSPAMGMTTRPVQIVGYVFALITILISGVVGTNIGTKHLYVSLLRNSHLLTSGGWRAQGFWILCVLFMWILGFILSQLIPFFNQLLTIVSSIFTVWFCFGLPGFMWLHLRHPYFANSPQDKAARTEDLKTVWRRMEYIVVAFSIIISFAITPLGLYSAIEGIISGYHNGSFKHPFSC